MQPIRGVTFRRLACRQGEAFVRALSQNGVGPDALNDIRRRIGLAPDPSLPLALAQRSIKPLSRQQIRSILDEHKETINHAAGNGTIRTHAEIYARHGNEALQRYEQTRRATTSLPTWGRGMPRSSGSPTRRCSTRSRWTSGAPRS